ncbi:MAG TPA: hypothetical protein VNY80_10105 [Steroidobacteraceae bacterium]|jgi:hypothetical protein|nr:hypothetical protein [Steroidobacteraceae bacterium]
MTGFEHLLKSYEVGDQLDDIASSDPPAYLRRCFAEGSSAPSLSWGRVQQLAVCAMVLDAIVNDRDYEDFEHELIADWRVHYAKTCAKFKDIALQALRRVLERDRPEDPAAAAELETLVSRLAGV